MRQLFLMMIGMASLFSQTLSWRGNYDKAHQEALHTHKPLLVLVVKAGDINTERVLRDVLMGQPYIEILNRQVVAVMVTYEGRSSYPIEMYYTTEFPALFLVNEQEQFLHKPIYGHAITKESIIQILENSL